mmetsp:Transcript_17543/g.21247  ORF Transcript_17543/g.21247 Transcript_17543/m.21247 type:complete len:89 (-) Transcript_17543:555-821(-)
MCFISDARFLREYKPFEPSKKALAIWCNKIAFKRAKEAEVKATNGREHISKQHAKAERRTTFDTVLLVFLLFSASVSSMGNFFRRCCS